LYFKHVQFLNENLKIFFKNTLNECIQITLSLQISDKCLLLELTAFHTFFVTPRVINSGPLTCQAGAVPFEPHPSPSVFLLKMIVVPLGRLI
jgi:hypothetical protein